MGDLDPQLVERLTKKLGTADNSSYHRIGPNGLGEIEVLSKVPPGTILPVKAFSPIRRLVVQTADKLSELSAGAGLISAVSLVGSLLVSPFFPPALGWSAASAFALSTSFACTTGSCLVSVEGVKARRRYVRFKGQCRNDGSLPETSGMLAGVEFVGTMKDSHFTRLSHEIDLYAIGKKPLPPALQAAYSL